ncbi:hypothetical protein BC628DRAFT_1414182 [Trametes gibbosa]|nr:hypothetical protein BC628DRAFT_1414182 [Trametes gibbosa]
MFARCPICIDRFSNEDELQPMRLPCGTIACIRRILQDGAGVCPSRCNIDREITTWLPLRLSFPDVVLEHHQVAIAVNRRVSELEGRHARSSQELNVVTSQVENQYLLIMRRRRYIDKLTNDLAKCRATIARRHEALLQLISQGHRLRREARPVASRPPMPPQNPTSTFIVNDGQNSSLLMFKLHNSTPSSAGPSSLSVPTMYVGSSSATPGISGAISSFYNAMSSFYGAVPLSSGMVLSSSGAVLSSSGAVPSSSGAAPSSSGAAPSSSAIPHRAGTSNGAFSSIPAYSDRASAQTMLANSSSRDETVAIAPSQAVIRRLVAPLRRPRPRPRNPSSPDSPPKRRRA